MSDERHNEAEQSEQQPGVVPVRLDAEYPERLSRLLLFVKWLLVIPLYVALVFYGIAAGLVTFFAFWAILLTGRFPEGMFDFVRGFLTFTYKTMAYFPFLMTDAWSLDFDSLDFKVDYPERLSRLNLIFVKLPSFLFGVAPILAGVGAFALFVATIPIWFIVLVSGKYPETLFRDNVRLLQWVIRVSAWQYLMSDDLSLFGTTRAVQVPVALGAVASLFIGLSPWLSIPVPGTDQWPGILTTVGLVRLDKSRAADTLERFVVALRTSDQEAALALTEQTGRAGNAAGVTHDLIACEVFKDTSLVRIKSLANESSVAGRLFEGEITVASGNVGSFRAFLLATEGDWKVSHLRVTTRFSSWTSITPCHIFFQDLGGAFAVPTPTVGPVTSVSTSTTPCIPYSDTEDTLRCPSARVTSIFDGALIGKGESR